MWLDAGVPHWILPVDDVDGVDLARIAPAIRAWRGFGAAGTNVDLVSWRGRELLVRTWERGVEGETLACGSGLLASAQWARLHASSSRTIRLRSRGGDRFQVHADVDSRVLWLEGPAAIVYRGFIPVAMLRPRAGS